MTSDEQQTKSMPGCFSHVDECCALTEQVPATSILRNNALELTCFDVGHHYFAFGSSCGTLFLFNRRLNRSTAPLRTNADEVITCVKLFSKENDFLAVGHKSGGLSLLNFPSGKPGSTRKLEQKLLLDGHKGNAITCIIWREDGSKVFSADDAGCVVVTSVDFVHNVFHTTFVCLEHTCIMQLTHINSLLAICSSRRVAVVDEKCGSFLLEIEEFREKIMGIHMATSSSGTELLLLSSDGVLVTYDVSSGEKKKTFSFLENLRQKFPSSKFPTSSRSLQVRPCMLTVEQHSLVISYEHLIILFDCGNEAISVLSFDVNSIFRCEPYEMRGFCVDPKDSWPSVFILCSDNHVYRLSSDEAPSFLTAAHEIPEEFSARNLFSSFRKTAKLFPYASKDAFWGGLKAAKDMNVFPSFHNFPLPILSAVIDSNSIPRDASDNSLCDESSDSDLETNKQNGVANSYGCSNPSKNLEQVQVQPSSVLNNVNKVVKKLVDTVGGFGAQVEDGFLAQPVHDADTVDEEGTAFPFEQSGILQEVMVRRTKKAPASKRKKNEEGKGTNECNLMNSLNEDLSPIDEHALKNIVGVLATPQTDEAGTQFHDSLRGGDDKFQNLRGGDGKQTATSSHDSQGADFEKRNGEGDVRNERGLLAEQSGINDTKNLAISELIFREKSAYEFLMMNAIEMKPSVSAGTTYNVTYNSDPEQLIKVIAVVNNFGDIWNEIKLPYSSASFSVSSHYMIICHSKKRKRPRYLPIPYFGMPQWTTLKQNAEHFVVNDPGTLVWKVCKNIAYAPTEMNSETGSLPATTRWAAVASEGGGVVEVALTNDSAWYITKSGEVYVQLCLPQMGILSRCETSWPLYSITASEVAVWALQCETGRLVVRAGLKHSPVGLDWVEVVPFGPDRLISICLHGQSGWAIDENRLLWFTNGVGFQSPFGASGSWMKVYSPWDISPDIGRLRSLPFTIRVSSAGVFVCVDHRCYWASSTSPVSGHRLEHVVPDKLAVDDDFELISGGSLRDEHDDILTLCRANEIFLYRIKKSYFYSLPAFPASYGSDVVEIGSFDGSVYVLDSSGCIYVKEHISIYSPFGTEWKLLDTGQCGAPVVSFAVTSISIWVVTAVGKVCLYVKKGKDPFVGTNPEWIHVKTLVDCAVDKIRASLNGFYVWIFSRGSGRAWARSFVKDLSPAGKSWTEASSEPGVYDLAVGCKVIWLLSSAGQLYWLQGLAAGNPAGNYWKTVPVSLKMITIDRRDRLWGIGLDKRLVSHTIELFPPSDDHRSGDSLERSVSSVEKLDEYVKF